MRLHDLGTGPGGVDVEPLAGDVVGVWMLQVPASLAGLGLAARVVYEGARRLQIAEGEEGSLFRRRLQIQRHLEWLEHDGVEGELLEGIGILAVGLDEVVAAVFGDADHNSHRAEAADPECSIVFPVAVVIASAMSRALTLSPAMRRMRGVVSSITGDGGGLAEKGAAVHVEVVG